MSTHPLRWACLLSFAAILFISAAPAGAEVCFTATIDGIQSGTGSTATGTATFILNDAQTELSYNIQFSGLLAAETAAHIHNDQEGGGVIHPLTLGSPKIGLFTSTDAAPFAMTPARVQDLLAGQLYVNIHSASFPAGEIRGQILPGACVETCFNATIDGPQAGTASPATGSALLSLNHTQTELTYNIVFSGLIGAETGAHIHNDAEGGGVIHPLTLGSPKIGVFSSTAAAPFNLSPQRVSDLLAGLLYVNIHSVGFQAGEIRGQILPAACAPSCFDAVIDGIQSGTGSPALGNAAAILNHTETRLDLHVTFSGLLAPESAAHIHSDAEGGGVIDPLVLGSPKIHQWNFNDAAPFALTPARVVDLKNNLHYVNIHSSMFPAGEIRGQLIQGCPPTGVGPIPQVSAVLKQNYPNPFNPSTTIVYSLGASGPVTIRVYDVSGRLVRTLVDGIGSPGPNQTVVWNGRDNSGMPVASGIYFYRLTAERLTVTKKMVLLK